MRSGLSWGEYLVLVAAVVVSTLAVFHIAIGVGLMVQELAIWK